MDVASYVLPAFALIITALQAYRRPRQPGAYAFSVVLCLLYAGVVMVSSQETLAAVIPVMSLAVIAANTIFSYSNHRADFLASTGIVIAAMLYLFALGTDLVPFIEAFAVGSLVALVLKYGYYQKANREDKKLEKRRDFFQIIIGMVSILVFVLAKPYAYILVFLFVMIGYTIAGFGTNHRAAGFLKSMERTGSVFGAGAIYMAVGTLLILGSITDYNYLLLALVALLICDAVATIVGVHGRHRLPYNKKKTLEGSLAYFAVLSIVGFMLASYYGIIFAAVLALLEGALDTVDDNIAVPLAAIAMYFIL